MAPQSEPNGSAVVGERDSYRKRTRALTRERCSGVYPYQARFDAYVVVGFRDAVYAIHYGRC